MLDLWYELLPEEDIESIDGCLLVVALGSDGDSDILKDYCVRKVERLRSRREFMVTIVEARYFKGFDVADGLPSMSQFEDGKRVEFVTGIDDCVEFFDEFLSTQKK